jgi:exopolyphosphatase/guanosine-5'-triphosphate,3'-diphosphate pyrophosphatase
VRDAENGEAFLGEIEWSYGFATRLLSGDEEAEWTRRGVGALEPGMLLVDIGGGSTELSTADFQESIDIGSVRLTERHLVSDPPTAEELEAAAGAVAVFLPDLEVTSAVGVAGTIGQLAALAGTDELSPAEIDRLTAELAALPLSERERVPNLDPKRAPVIVGGAIILQETLRRYRLDGIRFSVRDILDGIALEAAALPVPEQDDVPPGAYTCC